MADLFNKLKSLFVVVDDQSSKKQQREAEASQKASLETYVPEDIKDKAPEVQQEYLNILFKALEENNLEGYDYLEFRESLRSLGSVQMDADMKYKSAMAMAQSMDANKDHLLDSAMQYLEVLQKEEQKFEVALENQIDRKIGGNQNSIQELQTLIGDRQSEIEKLHAEISNLEQKMAEKKTQLEQASQKLHQVKTNFRASYEFIKSEIVKDIQNIKKI